MPLHRSSAAELWIPETEVALPEAVMSEYAVTARRGLMVVPPKDLAYALDVSTRAINSWKNGEVPVPEGRQRSIIQVTLTWGLEQMPLITKCASLLNDEVSRIYGPRHGHAARGDF